VGHGNWNIRGLVRAMAGAAISLAPMLAVSIARAGEPDGAAVIARAPVPENLRPLGVPASSTPTATARGAAPEVSQVGASALRTSLSLGAVLALLAGCAWAVKRMARGSGSLLAAAGPGGKSPSGILEMLGRYPLARGTTLMLLRVDRRVLLVSQSGGGVRGSSLLSTLCEISSPEDVASIIAKVRDHDGESLAKRFSTALVSAEKMAGAAVERATAPQAPSPPAAPVARRREVVSSAGDRAELWSVPVRTNAVPPRRVKPATVPSAPIAVPQAPDPVSFEPDSIAIDAAAETLRRRLVVLGSRPRGGEGSNA